MAITFIVVIRSCLQLAENYFNLVNAAVANRNYTAFDSLAIESERLNALVNVIGVLDSDVVSSTAELTNSSKAVPCSRDRRINAQTVEVRLYTENVLGNSNHVPSSSTCEP